MLTALTIGFLYPLAVSLGYVLLYPFATYRIMMVTNWHSNRIEELRIKNAGEAILSTEGAKALRKELYEQAKVVEKDLDEQIEKNRNLKANIQTAENRIVELLQDKSLSMAEAEKSERENKNHLVSIKAAKNEIVEASFKISQLEAEVERLAGLLKSETYEKTSITKLLDAHKANSHTELVRLKEHNTDLTKKLTANQRLLSLVQNQVDELKKQVGSNRISPANLGLKGASLISPNDVSSHISFGSDINEQTPLQGLYSLIPGLSKSPNEKED